MSRIDTKIVFMIFVGTIITAVLIGAIADEVFDQTNTRTSLNETFTLPAAQNTTVELTGRTLITARPNIENVTGDDVTQWYIVDNRLGTDGILTVAITSNGTSESLGATANTSYTYQPLGHAVNNNDRGIILLITIFSALAILIFVVVTLLMKEGGLSRLIRRG